ncbi:response regulator [Adhaeribacter aquaticus]|uniref:response regulator n=1 Tax=Adhaeribacter aquaticus TaxID=299567 RepID=UPI0004208274|nr:response regulator [Adhaeribacter aquaticus]
MNVLKILLAEDDFLNQILIQQVVESVGFDLDIAENGKVAVEKLQENDYDLVLMDIEMPEMNGYEATSYIRNELGAKSNIPIIVITSLTGTSEAAKCMLLGANTFLSKPLNAEDLIAEINTLVI